MLSVSVLLNHVKGKEDIINDDVILELCSWLACIVDKSSMQFI